MQPDQIDRLAGKTCPTCGATNLDAETLYVHVAAHAQTYWQQGSLARLEYSVMPAVGKLLHAFGVQLIDWMDQRSTEMDHGCLTGDCPHDMQEECLTRLLNDFLEDMRCKS